ncbi:hypothetical protein STEG23_002369 [Scotinomys teguina]
MACWVSTLESRPMLTLEINSRPFQGLLDTEVYIIHYMDDILLAAEHEREALKAFASLQDALSRASLQIAPEKDGEIPIWVPERCVRTVDASRSLPDGDPRGESTIVAV